MSVSQRGPQNKAQRQPIFVTGKDKPVAHVSNEWLIAHRRVFLQKPPAISFDPSVLSEAQRLGATRALVVNDDTGKQYVASLETILKHGVHIHRSYGEQVALPLHLWQDPTAPTQESLFTLEAAQ